MYLTELSEQENMHFLVIFPLKKADLTQAVLWLSCSFKELYISDALPWQCHCLLKETYTDTPVEGVPYWATTCS